MTAIAFSEEDFLAEFKEIQKEHRRMIFILNSSPRLWQKIALRKLAEAEEARKEKIKSRILTGSPATV